MHNMMKGLTCAIQHICSLQTTRNMTPTYLTPKWTLSQWSVRWVRRSCLLWRSYLTFWRNTTDINSSSHTGTSFPAAVRATPDYHTLRVIKTHSRRQLMFECSVLMMCISNLSQRTDSLSVHECVWPVHVQHSIRDVFCLVTATLHSISMSMSDLFI